MRFLIIWLILLRSAFCMHAVETTEFVCSNSAKKSAELTNCDFFGRYISWDLNFLRSVDNWSVKIIN